MKTTKDLLIISASNGENLKLAQRFLEAGKKLEVECSSLDLTSKDLPLYNPRFHQENGIPTAAISLAKELKEGSRWIICAPEYNGSIPPVLTSAIAWLSVQGDNFRDLFNGRPIGIATHSGGGGMEVLLSMRIQLSHLGAQVVGRQLLSTSQKPAEDKSINDLLSRTLQMNPLKL